MESGDLRTSKKVLRVFVVGDSHTALAEAQFALRWEPRMRVTLITDHFEHLNRTFGAEQPDVFVVTNVQHGLPPRDLLARLGVIFREPKIVLIYRGQPLNVDLDTLRLGCKGVVAHSAVKRQLLRAVLAVADGELWLGRSQLGKLLEQQQQDRLPQSTAPQPEAAMAALLTQGEQRIMAYVVKGMTNKEIARVLGISDKTVKTHISHILKKFGVARRQQMIFGASSYFAQQQSSSTGQGLQTSV